MPRGPLRAPDRSAKGGALARALVRGRGRALRVLADALPASVVFQHGPRRAREALDARRVALTFDDGPGPSTGELLEVLARARARATFFVIGDECPPYARELEEIVRRGHDLAGHGFSHTRFPELRAGDLEAELARTAALLPPSRAAKGIVRPPFGAMSPRSLLRTFRAGYASAMWSFDPLDYARSSAEEVARAVDPAALRDGDIVLLHEERRPTVEALPEMIDRLRGAGFELVTVTEIVRR